MNQTAKTKSWRNGLLAKVHIAKKQLGLTEEEYRDMLDARFGRDSAGELKMSELEALLRHMAGLGWKEGRARAGKADRHGTPRGLRAKGSGSSTTQLLSKIEALLAEKGRVDGKHVPWSYAAAILKRQSGVERLEWATPHDLRGVIAALMRDAIRHGRRTS